MDIREWIMNARNGDVEAMREMIDWYIAAEEWEEAISWADQAAETGDVNGLYKAAILHHQRMSSGANQSAWSEVRGDSRAVQKYAGMLSAMNGDGRLALNRGLQEVLREILCDALYCEALALYYEDADHEKAMERVKASDSTRERLLCGICLFELNGHREAIRKLRSAVNDSAYAIPETEIAEQRVWVRAVFVLSIMERMEMDSCERAVAALQQGIRKLPCEEIAKPLKAEMNRYRQTEFGNWKYE